VRTRDLDQARPALLELLSLLPHLRVVVLFGRVAQKGWERAKPTSSVIVLRAPHTSGRWLNAHPDDRIRIVETLVRARQLARLA
jgi:uracil-DNA glycosylase